MMRKVFAGFINGLMLCAALSLVVLPPISLAQVPTGNNSSSCSAPAVDANGVPGGSNTCPPSVPLPGFSIGCNFARAQYFPSASQCRPSVIRTTTGGVGSYVNDASGNWTLVADNLPRISNLGTLIEEDRINSIRNNSDQGAVAAYVADGVERTTNGSLVLNPISVSQNTLQNGWQWSVIPGGTTTVTWNGSNAVTIAADGTHNGGLRSGALTTVVGRSYVITVDVASAIVNVTAATTDGGADLVNVNSSTGAGQKFQFTATTTTTFVGFGRTSAASPVISNISVQNTAELIMDGNLALNPINASQSTVQNGWQWRLNGGTGTVTWNGSNSVTLTGDGTNAAQFSSGAITTIPGLTYTITLDASVNTNTLSAGTSAYAGNLLSTTLTATGTGQKFQFVATTTTSFVTVSKTVLNSTTIANISVQSAGALPTNWGQFFASGPNGSLAFTVVAIGTESGMETIDVRWAGTPTSNSSAFLFTETGTGGVAAVYGQTWTDSLFAKLQAGTMTNIISLTLLTKGNNAGGSQIEQVTVSLAGLTGAVLGTQRYQVSGTLLQPLTVWVEPSFQFNFNNSVAIDFTARLGWSQLENNGWINSSIASATVNAAGTGYGNALTGTMTWSGAGCAPNPVLNVTSNAGGGIATVNSVTTAGSCSTFPAAGATTWTPGGALSAGTGATFNLTPTNNSAQGFATSPIRTINGAVARGPDQSTIPFAAGASYTILGAGTPNAPSGYPITQNIIQSDAGTDAQRLVLRRQSGTDLLGALVGGTGAGFNPAGLWAQGVRGKFAASVSPGSQIAVFNGGTPATASAATLPTTPTTIDIGSHAGGAGEWFNGFVDRIDAAPTTQMPASVLQQVTTPGLYN